MRYEIAKQGAFLLGLNELSSLNNQLKAGNCPHGLPPGACPVCSQSGGGTLRQSDRNRKIGEMTYHECAMIGNMLRARALAQKNHEANLKHQAEALKQFETTMARMAEKMQQFSQILAQSFITKPIAFVVQNFAIPVLNFVQNIPKFIQNIKSQLPDIMDKLTAVFGEAKAFLNKKLETLKEVAKKLTGWLFKVFKKRNTDDDDTKIDDDKKIFNLKTILHKIKEKFTKKKDKKHDTEG